MRRFIYIFTFFTFIFCENKEHIVYYKHNDIHIFRKDTENKISFYTYKDNKNQPCFSVTYKGRDGLASGYIKFNKDAIEVFCTSGNLKIYDSNFVHTKKFSNNYEFELWNSDKVIEFNNVIQTEEIINNRKASVIIRKYDYQPHSSEN